MSASVWVWMSIQTMISDVHQVVTCHEKTKVIFQTTLWAHNFLLCCYMLHSVIHWTYVYNLLFTFYHKILQNATTQLKMARLEGKPAAELLGMKLLKLLQYLRYDHVLSRVKVHFNDNGAINPSLYAWCWVLTTHTACLIKHVWSDTSHISSNKNLQCSWLIIAHQLKKNQNWKNHIIHLEAWLFP